MKRNVQAKVENPTYLWIKQIVGEFPDLTASTITNYALEKLSNTATYEELAGLEDKVAAQKAENKKKFVPYGGLGRVK